MRKQVRKISLPAGRRHMTASGTLVGPKSGAVIVEMAVCLPLLITLLLGIINFGHVFYVRQVLTHATREGARVLMDRNDHDFALEFTHEFLSAYFNETSIPKLGAFSAGDVADTDDASVVQGVGYITIIPDASGTESTAGNLGKVVDFEVTVLLGDCLIAPIINLADTSTSIGATTRMRYTDPTLAPTP